MDLIGIPVTFPGTPYHKFSSPQQLRRATTSPRSVGLLPNWRSLSAGNPRASTSQLTPKKSSKSFRNSVSL